MNRSDFHSYLNPNAKTAQIPVVHRQKTLPSFNLWAHFRLFFARIRQYVYYAYAYWLPADIKSLSSLHAESLLNALPGLSDEPLRTLCFKQRKLAAVLIDAVLDEQLEPRQALNQWPSDHTDEDPSLMAAYQILWHFESDETQQQAEIFYMDTQWALLAQVTKCFHQGDALPLEILKLYNTEHQPRFYYPSGLWGSYCQQVYQRCQKIKRMLKLMRNC